MNPSNITSLETLRKASANPMIRFNPVKGATHFSALYPTTHLIAKKILEDTGPETNIKFSADEVDRLAGE